MPISEHLESFAGFTVQDFDPAKGIQDTAKTIYRLRKDSEEEPVRPAPKGFLGRVLGGGKAPPTPPKDPLEALLADPASRDLKGIVYGSWLKEFDSETSSEEIVRQIAEAKDRLPGLQALFVGDMTLEECEISWITQSDVAPLLRAFPRLEHFGVRGSNGLGIGPVQHANLKSLVIQCGGLPASVLRQVLQSDYPALEHLELWLGEEGYGADIKVADLQSLLDGRLFPKLSSLGLRDSELADEVAAAVSKAPILERIKVLDLSLGNLSDAGAEALLQSPMIARLERLDLHHHFVSPALTSRLEQLGPSLDASDRQKAETYDGKEYRFISVGE
jgi:hypothetical protein